MSSDPKQLIAFDCPGCGKRLKAPSKAAGKEVKCPKCQAPLRVPTSEHNDEPPAHKSSLLEMEDPFSLAAPAISDLDQRKQASDGIRAEKEKQRQLEQTKRRNREKSHQERTASATDTGKQRVRPASKKDQYVPTARKAPKQADESPIPFDSLDDNSPKDSGPDDDSRKEDTAATTEHVRASTGTPSSEDGSETSQPGEPVASVFDQDLPDLSELKLEDEEPLRKSPTLAPGLAQAVAAEGAAEDDLRDLDDLMPELEQRGVLPEVAEEELLHDAEYRIVCPTCGTAQYVSPSVQGMKVKCPDCYSMFKAPAPPSNWKPKKVKKLPVSAEISLAANADFDEQQADRRVQNKTKELLDKAEVEINSEEEDQLYKADFDTAGFAQRTFGFLRDPLTMAQVVVYGIVFAGLFALVRVGLNDTESYFGRGLLMATVVGIPIVGFLFSLPMLSGALALIEAVANKQRYVRELPAFNIFDNFVDVMVIAVALIAALAPGFAIGTFFAEGGLVRIGGMLVSGFILFPVFLLSMMDNSSILAPLSTSVLRSMSEAKESWGGYYLKTAVASFIVFLLWAMLLGGSPILAAVAGFLVPLLVFFTCQQIGALADAISDSLSFAFEPPSDDEEDDEATHSGRHRLDEE